MRKKKLRVLSALLLMITALGLFSMGGSATDTSMLNTLWVNGVNIGEAVDNTVDCGEGTAAYNPETGTLTLTNAVIETGYNGQGIARDISTKPLNIVLVGENSITSNENSEMFYGICSSGKVNIKGKGSLVITTSTTSTQLSEGITVGSLAVSGAKITLKEISDDTTQKNLSSGIRVGENLSSFSLSNAELIVDGFDYAVNIPNNDLKILKSNITITDANVGICGGNIVDNYSIVDSTVNIDATRSKIYPGRPDYTQMSLGLLSGCEITIDNSKLNISSTTGNSICTDGAITILNGSEVKGTAYYPVLYSVEDTTIDHSVVDATSSNDSAIFSRDTILIQNKSNVKATAYYCALNSATDMTITDSVVDATSSDDSAIFSRDTILIQNKSNVKATAYYSALNSDTDMTITDSVVDAASSDDMAVYTRGKFIVNSGEVHAKGGEKKAAIGALSLKAADGDVPTGKIILGENYSEVSGGKISVSDWYEKNGNNYAYTSFIAKDDTKLKTDRSNALNEVTIKIKGADYTKVDAAIAKIPGDLSIYTKDSAKAVTDAKAAVVRDKNITEQAVVDGYATAIDTAVKNLKWGAPFADVKTGDWYADAVEFVGMNRLFFGTSATEFSPDVMMDRAMIISVLYRMEGSPEVSSAKDLPFTDVNKDGYYFKALNWGYENGIIAGVTNTSFVPNNPVTREQIASFIYRYSEYKKMDVTKRGDLTKFADYSATFVSAFAQDAMEWAVGEKILQGDNYNKLNPQKGATRAEVAQMIMSYADKK